jgi:hypothetical protein
MTQLKQSRTPYHVSFFSETIFPTKRRFWQAKRSWRTGDKAELDAHRYLIFTLGPTRS